jgi:hypothetical protein
MSCLILADLSLSEHIAMELERAARMAPLYRAALNRLDAAAQHAVTPCTAPTLLGAAGSNPPPMQEPA